MGKKFFKNNIIIENDVILLFSIFQCANSYQFIDEIGYYYFLNKDSISKSRYDSRKINKIIYSCFTNIRFLFERTENSYLDKYFCIFKIEQFYHRQIKSLKKNCIDNKTYEYIQNIFNKIIKSKYISNKNKIIISRIQLELMKYKK